MLRLCDVCRSTPVSVVRVQDVVRHMYCCFQVLLLCPDLHFAVTLHMLIEGMWPALSAPSTN